MKWMLMAGLALAACGGGKPTEPVPPVVPPIVQEPLPLTGLAVVGMTSFDDSIRTLMRRHGVPGGTVAVVRAGKLIYARGFGYSDLEAKTPVEPDALFRIASVSKPITAVAILKLVEQGKLKLDDRMAPYIAQLAPAPGKTVDARWEKVTIRHLLEHTGGWDRDKQGGFDPMFIPQLAASTVGAPAPATAETVIRYMKGMPFDFEPGTKHVYSNFGYAILGRIIEKVTGQSYEAFVRNSVLAPMGAARTRLGFTQFSLRLPDEVKYYFPGAGFDYPLVQSVVNSADRVPYNYGGFYVEAMDAHGGWVSSAVDLMRFVTAVDRRSERPDFLSNESLQQMVGSGAPVCANNECWYGLGWMVRPAQGDFNWWHGGSLPGTTSIIVRSYHNFAWVALFNARTDNGAFGNELDAKLWQALGAVNGFPTHDLFSSFR